MKYAWTFLITLTLLAFANCRVTADQQVAAETNALPQVTATTLPAPERPILTAEDNLKRIETEKQMLKGERLHDGSMELELIGTIESVPALLYVVNKYKTTNGTMICTKAHAISALWKITGEKFTSDDDWNKWWQDRQNSQAK